MYTCSCIYLLIDLYCCLGVAGHGHLRRDACTPRSQQMPVAEVARFGGRGGSRGRSHSGGCSCSGSGNSSSHRSGWDSVGGGGGGLQCRRTASAVHQQQPAAARSKRTSVISTRARPEPARDACTERSERDGMRGRCDICYPREWVVERRSNQMILF